MSTPFEQREEEGGGGGGVKGIGRKEKQSRKSYHTLYK